MISSQPNDTPTSGFAIDGSFVQNLPADPTNQALVLAIATVSHTLGKTVIAE